MGLYETNFDTSLCGTINIVKSYNHSSPLYHSSNSFYIYYEWVKHIGLFCTKSRECERFVLVMNVKGYLVELLRNFSSAK